MALDHVLVIESNLDSPFPAGAARQSSQNLPGGCPAARAVAGGSWAFARLAGIIRTLESVLAIRAAIPGGIDVLGYRRGGMTAMDLARWARSLRTLLVRPLGQIRAVRPSMRGNEPACCFGGVRLAKFDLDHCSKLTGMESAFFMASGSLRITGLRASLLRTRGEEIRVVGARVGRCIPWLPPLWVFGSCRVPATGHSSP